MSKLKYIFLFLVVVFAFIYAKTAHVYSRSMNTNAQFADQSKYIRNVKKVKETNYRYLGDRNIMPIYPHIQALFYSPQMTDEEAFVRGKNVNIAISLLVLFATYFVSSKYLKKLHAFTFTVICAIALFVVRAGAYQVELLFFFFGFCTFLLFNKLLLKPSAWKAFLIGLFAGVTYLLKASIFLGITVFILYWIGLSILEALKNSKVKKTLLPKIKIIAFVILGFLVSTSLYLIQTKKIYGKYIYNVNTNFYVWYDTPQEIQEGTQAHGELEGWPKMAEKDIPSMKKYLKSHTFSEIIERELVGVVYLVPVAIATSTAFIYFAFYSIFAFYVWILNWGEFKKFFKKYKKNIYFTIAFIGIYLLAYAWFMAIEIGSRYILSLFMPAMFSVFFALEKIKKINRKRKDYFGLSYLDMFNLISIFLIIIDFNTVTKFILRNVRKF